MSDQRLDEITALLARIDAVPSMGHLDSAELGWVRPVLHDLLDENQRLRAAVTEAEEERDELRTRIGNARAEIARQDTAATLAMRPGYCDVSDALAAVETHLVDPEHRERPQAVFAVAVAVALEPPPAPAALTVTCGPHAGRSVRLGDAPVTIGRDPDCDLTLDDEYASPRHALLKPSAAGVWTVEDLGSTNGTFLGAARVMGPAVVAVGSVIRVGRTTVGVRDAIKDRGES